MLDQADRLNPRKIRNLPSLETANSCKGRRKKSSSEFLWVDLKSWQRHGGLGIHFWTLLRLAEFPFLIRQNHWDLLIKITLETLPPDGSSKHWFITTGTLAL